MTIWTVGHSKHDISHLVHLLRETGIEAVADIRSQPFSRFSPQFNRHDLKAALLGEGLSYVFLGQELGGRPPEPELYDDEGHVLYGEVAKTERFLSGIDRLLEGAGSLRVAMLCSEEDPTNCHRRLLVTRVLSTRDVEVLHIRGDGAIQLESELSSDQEPPSQAALFGEESPAWRSTQSVSRSTPQKTSSRS